METCYYLSKQQISRGCMGSIKSNKCISSCSVYANRVEQCQGKLSIESCKTCILNLHHYGGVVLRDVCQQAQERKLLGDTE